jgi:hypothetical protein
MFCIKGDSSTLDWAGNFRKGEKSSLESRNQSKIITMPANPEFQRWKIQTNFN